MGRWRRSRRRIGSLWRETLQGLRGPRPSSYKSPLRRSRRRWVTFAAMTVVLFLLSELIALAVLVRSRAYQARRLAEVARIELGLGHPEKAVEVLSQAIELAPEDAEHVVTLSRVHLGLRQVGQAEAALRAGLERLPHSRRLSLELVDHLVLRWRAREAVELVSPLLAELQALPEGEERCRALAVAGRALAAAGELERGEELLRRAGESGPPLARAQALRHLAELLRQSWRVQAALQVLKQAEELAPKEESLRALRARLWGEGGRGEEALSELQALYRSGSDRLGAAQSLGDLLVRTRRLDQARALAAEIAQEPGGEAVASYLRGAIAVRTGDLETAHAEYKQLAEELPELALPHLLGARAALRSGDTPGARTGYELALRAQPGAREAELGLLVLDQGARDWEQVRLRALRLLEDPLTRPRAICALFVAYNRDAATVSDGLQELVRLQAKYPEDRAVRLYAAIFRLLAEDSGGVEELEKLAEEPDMAGALALLARAQLASSDALEAIELLARLATQDSQLAPARVVLARLYRHLGRSDLAGHELDAAVETDPTLKLARWHRVQLALASGDLASATADLEDLCQRSPEDTRMLAALAEVRLRTGAYRASVKLLEEACRLEPSDAVLRASLARAQAVAGDESAALQSFTVAKRLAPRLADAYQDGGLLLSQGEASQARGVFATAVSVTHDARFVAALAAALAIEGELTQALEVLSRWRQARPEDPSGIMLQETLRALAGREPSGAVTGLVPVPILEAAAALTPAVEIPAVVRLVCELFALKALGWSAAAAARSRQLEELGGESALWVWWSLYGLEGYDPEGRQPLLLKRLMSLLPDELNVGLELSLRQRREGRIEAELETLVSLESRFRDDPALALNLGGAYERAGNRAAAVEQFARAAKVEQPDPLALNNLAYLLGEAGERLGEAIDYARRAVALDSTRGEFHDTLGWLLLLDGQTQEAVEHLSHAASLLPAQPTVRFHLARGLLELGEGVRARNHLQIALLSRLTFPERAACEELLRSQEKR